jgi:hypothetical protein
MFVIRKIICAIASFFSIILLALIYVPLWIVYIIIKPFHNASPDPVTSTNCNNCMILGEYSKHEMNEFCEGCKGTKYAEHHTR